ncbi:unnamed protein product, partial [Prorocentrum cordatum]
MTMRLRYLQRLVLLRPSDLVALLHFRPKGQPLPWVRLVAADCEFLRRQGLVPPAMPGFFDAPLQWDELVADRLTWADTVGSAHFCDSCLGRDCTVSSATPLTVKCRMCSAFFASPRARACHERIAHRVTTKAKCYLHGTVCPCCKVDFRQKICLLEICVIIVLAILPKLDSPEERRLGGAMTAATAGEDRATTRWARFLCPPRGSDWEVRVGRCRVCATRLDGALGVRLSFFCQSRRWERGAGSGE